MLKCCVNKRHHRHYHIYTHAIFSVSSMTLTSQIVHRTSSFMGWLANTSRQFPSAVSACELWLLICSICKRECTFTAALSFDFGIGCSFSFGLCGSCLTAVRHALRSCAISSQCLLLISAAWRCRFVQSV